VLDTSIIPKHYHDSDVTVCWNDGVLDAAFDNGSVLRHWCARTSKSDVTASGEWQWFLYNRCSHNTRVFFGLEIMPGTLSSWRLGQVAYGIHLPGLIPSPLRQYHHRHHQQFFVISVVAQKWPILVIAAAAVVNNHPLLSSSNPIYCFIHSSTSQLQIYIRCASVYLPRPSVPEYVPEGVRTPQLGSFSTEE
jgi:hypothetical protein